MTATPRLQSIDILEDGSEKQLVVKMSALTAAHMYLLCIQQGSALHEVDRRMADIGGDITFRTSNVANFNLAKFPLVVTDFVLGIEVFRRKNCLPDASSIFKRFIEHLKDIAEDEES